MPKLRDTQLTMLSSAKQRPDGVIKLPEDIKSSEAQKAVGKLLCDGLVEEVLSGRDVLIWRRDEPGSAPLIDDHCVGQAGDWPDRREPSACKSKQRPPRRGDEGWKNFQSFAPRLSLETRDPNLIRALSALRRADKFSCAYLERCRA